MQSLLAVSGLLHDTYLFIRYVAHDYDVETIVSADRGCAAS